ncbi:hypothetical protein [Paraburkholderia bannensis]|uniref:hypothetical protein n=1 Tax=Paraburkholderia bannensis TaxID=765414 RepID=UPI002AB65673|nr:hypothetical protein [Paraburkholderia bannensis]
MSLSKPAGTKHQRARVTGSRAAGRPGDRPRGAPRRAALAGGIFCAVFALLLAELYGVLSDLIGYDFGAFMLVEIVVGSAMLLLVAGGMGSGKLWAVKLFRWSTHVAALLYVLIFAGGIYLLSGKSPVDSGLGWLVLVASLIELPLFVVIYRALDQVRWLDPKSLPSEWEAPGGSSNARDSDTESAKLGFRGRLFVVVIGTVIFLRYYLGLLRSNWVGEWLDSGSVPKAITAIVAIPAPFIVLGLTLWLQRRARQRHSRTGD